MEFTAKRKRQKVKARVTGFAVAQEKGSSKQHEIFVMKIQWGTDLTWTSYKRYSQFLKCHQFVKEIMKRDVPSFPGKQIFRSHDASFLKERRDDLNVWMTKVADASAQYEDIKEILWAFLSDPESKKPPAGLGTIFSGSADDDEIDSKMSSDKSKVSVEVQKKMDAAAKEAEERARKREEIAKKQAANQERIKQLKHQRDIYMSLLKVGEAFLKHGRWGKPKKNFVKVEKSTERDGMDIVWRKGTKESRLPFEAVVKVMKGKETEVFERDEKSEEALCFSLILKDARKDSLDLEASTKDTRKRWCEAWSFLLVYKETVATADALTKKLAALALETESKDKKSALESAHDAIVARQEKMKDVELASERLADSAADFSNMGKALEEKASSGLFGSMAAMMNSDE